MLVSNLVYLNCVLMMHLLTTNTMILANMMYLLVWIHLI